MLILQLEDNAAWLAPYAYAIVLLGFLIVLFRIVENWYADVHNRPLYRHFLVHRNLAASQETVLSNEFAFYRKLSKRHKRQFRHRVATFLKVKSFVGREDLQISDRMKTMVAAIGCMLSFGRRNYTYGLIEHILIYPGQFYSKANDAYHKGEFNPRERALVLSWKDFERGFQIENDNINLGIHEFMHAMQLEAKQSNDLDSARFSKHFQHILEQLTRTEIKERLEHSRYFRKYAFTNQYEFMAVLAEYFIESPTELKAQFPELYTGIRNVLNFRFAGY